MRILLVIDMLNDFCRRDGELYLGDQVKKCILASKELVKTFRENEEGIVYLCDSHSITDIEFDLFPKHCIEGTHGEIVIDELEPTNNDMVMDKQTYSGAWDNRELLEILDQDGSDVYVCGLCTSICVMETVSDLYKYGIRVKIVEKACCDIDDEAHVMAINRMRLLFGSEII